MKQQMQSIHWRTYISRIVFAVIHRLKLTRSYSQWTCVWKTVLTFMICCIILKALSKLDANYASQFILKKSFFNPAVCSRVAYMESQYKSVQGALEEQIHLQSLFLETKKINEALKKRLLPSTQKILDAGYTICPYQPPDLMGSLVINCDYDSLDQDLLELEKDLKEQVNMNTASYLSRNTRSVLGDLDGKALHSSHSNNEKQNFKIDSDTVIRDKNLKNFSYLSNRLLPVQVEKPPAGVHSPKACFPHRRTAIVVPYRNRFNHLKVFLRHMHSFLQRQQIEYGIYVINLAGNGLFNRAKLLNIGFKEVLQHYPNYDCLVFHDVDLLPEDDRNLYTCSSQPKHMSVAIDIFHYRIPYQQIFGGVTAMTPSQFQVVNGYSNEYWGWGGEDDDMFIRISRMCMSVYRLSSDIARYHMAKHSHDKGNEVMSERFNILKGASNRQSWDGLSSLKYKALDRQYSVLYNNITVVIGSPDRPNRNPLPLWQHMLVAGLCIFIIYLLLLRADYSEDSKT